jgi:hypothetical protein
MSNRAERREAERLARKLAYQEARNKPPQAAAPKISETQISESQVSEAQLRANRANAQQSTGPITPEGRAASSRNALKTGLTGRTVLLPTDDPSEYNQRLQSAMNFYSPVTEEEQNLVHSIVDIDWRLNRIVTLETGIYLKGTLEFAEAHKDQPKETRQALIHAETYLKYEKPLRNLNIQEARLQRQRTKAVAELKRLPQENAREERTSAAPKTQAATANGFEFSTDANVPAAAPHPAQSWESAPAPGENNPPNPAV